MTEKPSESGSAQTLPARQFLQSVIDSLADPIKIVDQNFNIVFANQPAEAALGKPRRNVMGCHCFAEFYQLDSKCAFCRSEITFQTGQPQMHTVQFTAPGQTDRYVEFKNFPIKDENGQVRFVVEVTHDVTEARRMEEDLRRSERLASMGEIAAGVAHEINNPIGIILGFAQDVLAATGDDDPNRDALQIIEQEAQRCGRVVQGLLTFARPDSPTIRTTSLAAVIEDSLVLLRSQLNRAGIQLKTALAPDLPLLRIDPDQVQQVLVNVLLNAVHATPINGTITVDLSAAREGETEWQQVVVRDTGTGISPEHLDKVFDPFFSTKSTKGTGLGLSISRRIVEAQGGSMTISNAPQGGAVCEIRFPGHEE